MAIDLIAPDLEVALDLGPYAPREARYHVAQVDRPSPDLRDAVSLLTSELVTRAVQQGSDAPEEVLRLRIWMPADVVRVELWASRELLCVPPSREEPNFDLLLLSQIADRWAIDVAPPSACMWFEIDRHEPAGVWKPELSEGRTEVIPRRRPFVRRPRGTVAGGFRVRER